MPFTRKAEKDRLDDIGSAGKFFPPISLDNADVVADCRVEVSFDPARPCDALVAVFAADDDGDVGEPIDDLAFIVDHRLPRPDQPQGRNSVSFAVTGIERFVILVRATGIPNCILPSATLDLAIGSLTNREVAA